MCDARHIILLFYGVELSQGDEENQRKEMITMIEKTITKDASRFIAIVTVLFMMLVVIYQTTSSHRDLGTDLNIVFANFKK